MVTGWRWISDTHQKWYDKNKQKGEEHDDDWLSSAQVLMGLAGNHWGEIDACDWERMRTEKVSQIKLLLSFICPLSVRTDWICMYLSISSHTVRVHACSSFMWVGPVRLYMLTYPPVLPCRTLDVTLDLKDPQYPENNLGSLELAVTLSPREGDVRDAVRNLNKLSVRLLIIHLFFSRSSLSFLLRVIILLATLVYHLYYTRIRRTWPIYCW